MKQLYKRFFGSKINSDKHPFVLSQFGYFSRCLGIATGWMQS